MIDLEEFDKQALTVAHMMLNTITQAINEATGEEKLRLIVEYAPVVRELQRAVHMIARSQQRQRGYREIETKDSR